MKNKAFIVFVTSLMIGLFCCRPFIVYCAADSGYTTDYVRLRTAPSLEAEIITVLNPGYELKILNSVNDEWTEVQWNGSAVYISSEYIALSAWALKE